MPASRSEMAGSNLHLFQVTRPPIFLPMAEAIQQLILEVLDKNGTIQDTRKLTLPGQSSLAATQDDQLAIIAALNSLLSRDVID
jgi:hypothetical protein